MKGLVWQVLLSLAVAGLVAIIFSGFGKRVYLGTQSLLIRSYDDGMVALIALIAAIIVFTSLRIWEGGKK